MSDIIPVQVSRAAPRGGARRRARPIGRLPLHRQQGGTRRRRGRPCCQLTRRRARSAARGVRPKPPGRVGRERRGGKAAAHGTTPTAGRGKAAGEDGGRAGGCHLWGRAGLGAVVANDIPPRGGIEEIYLLGKPAVNLPRYYLTVAEKGWCQLRALRAWGGTIVDRGRAFTFVKRGQYICNGCGRNYSHL